MVTRTDTRTVPRMVSNALCGTSGITSLTGDGAGSGGSGATISTGGVAVGVAGSTVRGCGGRAGVEVSAAGAGSGLDSRMPVAISAAARAPAIHGQGPVNMRRQRERRASSGGTSFTRMISRRGCSDVFWRAVAVGDSTVVSGSVRQGRNDENAPDCIADSARVHSYGACHSHWNVIESCESTPARRFQATIEIQTPPGNARFTYRYGIASR
jgi:hypothetical protein